VRATLLLNIFRKLQRINRQRISAGLVKILYHTDAAQAVGKILVDVEDLLVDYLTIVGHKVKCLEVM
jgi:selenocysteine lyase